MSKSPKAPDALRPTITAPPIVGPAPGGSSALHQDDHKEPPTPRPHTRSLCFLLATVRLLNQDDKRR